MAYSKQTLAILIAVVVLVLILVAFFVYKKKPAGESFFHGWRSQHYSDWPYNGQQYRCGSEAPCPPTPFFTKDKFSGDEMNWPQSGVFGNTADTAPYFNYAGHVDMTWPELDNNQDTYIFSDY